MTRRQAARVSALALCLVCLASPLLAQTYRVSGMVLEVDRARRVMTVSHDAIDGLMPAMAMPFEVRTAGELEKVVPGAVVEFSLVVSRQSSHAERVRVVKYESVEPDPLGARRLKLLGEIVGSRQVKPVAIGETVPDFTLTDQRRREVTLSSFRGKVVAVNFIYTRCALPNFCLRIANNFAVLQKRFGERLGRDLVLLTVTFDPTHDTPEALARYAAQLNANPAGWRFLTGPAGAVSRVCRLFGVDAFPDEGLMNHSLHTALIDRQGKLIADIEGNQFTATQLGDLTERALR